MSKVWDQHKKVLLPLMGAVVVILLMALTGFGTGFDFGIFDSDGSTKRKTYKEYPKTVITSGFDYSAVVNVKNVGSFTIDLFEEEVPKGVNSFVFLAEEKFFDGLTIHYINGGTLFQTGDPKGDGSGGPGYTFVDEIKSSVAVKAYSVVYANEGTANSNGSQFFVVCSGVSSRKLSEWNGEFTVFGEVTEGTKIVDSVCGKETNSDGSPKTAIKIQTVTIKKVSY
ncbi:peptidylprolyl isomerase [Candidatus Dojkabacteria bacterium]|nr:peptidylprolyl isomerase [Candidatus Dojkabacteria bacterium]